MAQYRTILAKRWLTLVAILIAAGAGAWWWHQRKSQQPVAAGAVQPDRIFEVKRGDLEIGFTHSGTITAHQQHKLSLQASVNTKLVWIIEENSRVKAGDVLVKFENAEIKTRIDDLKLQISNTDKELAIVREERRILESTNQADIKAAQNRLREVNEAFTKYRRLEGPRSRDQITLRVNESARKYETAQLAYEDFLVNKANTSYPNPAAEEKAKQDELNLKQAMEMERINYESALLERKLFKRYTHPNQMTKMMNDLTQAQLELEKTQVRANSQLAQKDNQVTGIETRIKQLERDLERHNEYLTQMELTAPVDGVVIYGDPNQRWGDEIRVGMDVMRGRVLCTIPDMSVLMVKFELAERFRSRVEAGAKVVVSPESIPELKLPGRIERIAPLPVNQIQWDPTSPRIYPSSIELTGECHDSRLVNGMSVRIEIISEVLTNVLFVPVEAVFEEKGETFVYVFTGGEPRRQPVVIGRGSDNFIEIKEGVNAGDRVFLYRPFQGRTDNK